MKGQLFFRELAQTPKYSGMDPKLGSFLKDYLAGEKVIRFGDLAVINTHFPPYPSAAFDTMIDQFGRIGQACEARHLYSVTIAVTNRCPYNCWHCYNAGRSQEDLSLAQFQAMADQLNAMHVVKVTLSGGEPLIRADLEAIVSAFGPEVSTCLNTTGFGLTAERARQLKEAGLFALGVSLDSMVPDEHDRMRGKPGAFDIALEALNMASEAGLYPYVIAVATRDLLCAERFYPFMEFVASTPALEVHLLEPCATGKLEGQSDVCLTQAERSKLLDYQKEFATDEATPILSTFAHLESAQAFGCGAGLTHLYIDGSGEVCPCNFVPLSFGNIKEAPVASILSSMGQFFKKPRTTCVGQCLTKHVDSATLPASPEQSVKICEQYLEVSHAVPELVHVQEQISAGVGSVELQNAYDKIHGDYDQFWLTQAATPIHELIDHLPFTGHEEVLEAGCGTGYATALLAQRARHVTAVDLSEGMLTQARTRLSPEMAKQVDFVQGDALTCLKGQRSFNLVFSSWVLGYIKLTSFFSAARSSLATQGLLAFVVHKQNSPTRELEIFRELAAENPSVLERSVHFDFPNDMNHVQNLLQETGFSVSRLWEGVVSFEYQTAHQALEHLLKSGAGTAYYEAVDPDRREALEQAFVNTLAERTQGRATVTVDHEYVACIAKVC